MSGPDGKTEGKIEVLEGELATGRLHLEAGIAYLDGAPIKV